MTVERATPGDRAMRARSARSRVPEHLGAILLLDPPVPAPEELRRLVAARLGAVPRLRRHLVRVPPGAGGPVWAELPGFDGDLAVELGRCPAPGDERALLDLAAELAGAPLDRDGPLWRATVVTGLTDGRCALVVVLDHVLADGIGGLAALGHLVDGSPPPPQPRAGRPPYRALVADSVRRRLRTLPRLPGALRAAARAVRAGRGFRSSPAAACSLLAPTGRRRVLAVARADLAAVQRTAHAAGATVNDALLSAVGGALHDLLAGRGESVAEFRVAVMVAVSRSRATDPFGNAAVPLVVPVPAAGPAVDRLRRMSGVVAGQRAQVADPEAAAAALPLLRLAAVLGLYRWWMRRQRLLHTLVSDVVGPPAPVSVAGAPVAALIPLSSGDSGNVTTSFVCASYAGTLTVTAVVDRDRVPDVVLLQRALQSSLDELTDPAPVAGQPAERLRGGSGVW